MYSMVLDTVEAPIERGEQIIISEVYRAEASAKTHEARFAVHQARTRPLLEERVAFRKARMLKTLPKSQFAQEFSYAIKQEVEVMRIMESGVYELDNNSIQRQMKYIAIDSPEAGFMSVPYRRG